MKTEDDELPRGMVPTPEELAELLRIQNEYRGKYPGHLVAPKVTKGVCMPDELRMWRIQRAENQSGPAQ